MYTTSDFHAAACHTADPLWDYPSSRWLLRTPAVGFLSTTIYGNYRFPVNALIVLWQHIAGVKVASRPEGTILGRRLPRITDLTFRGRRSTPISLTPLISSSLTLLLTAVNRKLLYRRTSTSLPASGAYRADGQFGITYTLKDFFQS